LRGESRRCWGISSGIWEDNISDISDTDSASASHTAEPCTKRGCTFLCTSDELICNTHSQTIVTIHRRIYLTPLTWCPD
jgi:hypothetical protein